jgi:hypothetical protein
MLEPTNMVDHESPPYYQACRDFHEENTCARYLDMVKNEASAQDDDKLFGFLQQFV